MDAKDIRDGALFSCLPDIHKIPVCPRNPKDYFISAGNAAEGKSFR